jgi:S1-C subfamily serine protease
MLIESAAIDVLLTKVLSRRLVSLILILSLIVFAIACRWAGSVTILTPSAAPTAPSTPKPTVKPTPTVTPGPLQPSQIFDRVSPSVVFVDTPGFFGSGVLISEGYIVTNAHVVWPFDKVRVVFSDGSEYANVPVMNWDLMGDLALVGPVETDVEPVELVDGEDLVIGRDVFLIGYPGEVDEFPQPTITRGLISRLRQWEPVDVTFFQTDAMIAGGQSGGVLVSEFGEVIGISGFSFSEAAFGLVASAIDVLPRIQGLIAGEDTDGLGDRCLLLEGGELDNQALLHHEWESHVFVVNQPVGTEIEIKVSGINDGGFVLMDVLGYVVAQADEGKTGTEQGSAEIELEAPYILDVFQNDDSPQLFRIKSSHHLIPYQDVDDGKIVTSGQTVLANLDYPGDVDFFEVDLKAGETINIMVDSILIDPFLIVGQPGNSGEELVFDDDTAGGIFGANAELTFEAPHNGTFLLIVQDSYGYDIGGYLLTVDAPYEGAPTPMAPPPTPTPISSPFGRMALYESQTFPFTMEYPAAWTGEEDAGLFATMCDLVTVCLIGQDGILAIAEEDTTALGVGTFTLEEYVDVIVSNATGAGSQSELLSRESQVTAQGQPAEVLVLSTANGALRMVRFTTMHEGVAFGATYVVSGDVYAQKLPMIEYSFSTFQVVEQGQ